MASIVACSVCTEKSDQPLSILTKHCSDSEATDCQRSTRTFGRGSQVSTSITPTSIKNNKPCCHSAIFCLMGCPLVWSVFCMSRQRISSCVPSLTAADGKNVRLRFKLQKVDRTTDYGPCVTSGAVGRLLVLVGFWSQVNLPRTQVLFLIVLGWTDSQESRCVPSELSSKAPSRNLQRSHFSRPTLGSGEL